MNKLLEAIIHMNDLDDFAMGDSRIHRFHPLFKLIICLIALIFILSTSSLIELSVYLFITLFLGYIAYIPVKQMIHRGLLGLPFSLCIGISNILLDHTLIQVYGLTMTNGIFSCIVILLRTTLCLMVTYLLIATTPFNKLSSELVRIHVPAIFVLQLTMTYRYIFTFLEEAKTMAEAYALRHPQAKGIEMKDMGSFVGHLLVKSMVQSERVYQCMICRGFNIRKTYHETTAIEVEDLFLSMMIVAGFILIKGVVK